jgi:hypothetical protein
MSNFGSRIMKPLVLAAATFWSVNHLGLGAKESFLVALIPLALGVLSLMTAIGYAIAVAALLIAVASSVYPPIKTHIGRLMPQASAEPTEPTATPPTNKD